MLRYREKRKGAPSFLPTHTVNGNSPQPAITQSSSPSGKGEGLRGSGTSLGTSRLGRVPHWIWKKRRTNRANPRASDSAAPTHPSTIPGMEAPDILCHSRYPKAESRQPRRRHRFMESLGKRRDHTKRMRCFGLELGSSSASPLGAQDPGPGDGRDWCPRTAG